MLLQHQARVALAVHLRVHPQLQLKEICTPIQVQQQRNRIILHLQAVLLLVPIILHSDGIVETAVPPAEIAENAQHFFV